MPRERGEVRLQVDRKNGDATPVSGVPGSASCACMSGWPLSWAVIAVIFFLDQGSKYLAVIFLSRAETVPVFKGIFHLTLVFNTGAAFGMFQSQPYLFAAIALLAVFFINYLLVRKTDRMSGLERLALCFILGGTLGNLADRLRLGHVIDFFDLRVWPVFNVADSFITVGAVMLGLAVIWGIGRKKTDDGRQTTESPEVFGRR